jgi:small-conductance mechanosensitive channel
MSEEAAIALISLGTLIAGVVVIVVGLNYRARMRELRHKERLAMIERGIMPPAEFDPRLALNRGLKQRSLSFGIIVVGLGFGLMFLIGIAAGAVDSGIGIGGAVAILGAAFIVRSIYAPAPLPPSRPDVPPPPPAQPTDSSLMP